MKSCKFFFSVGIVVFAIISYMGCAPQKVEEEKQQTLRILAPEWGPGIALKELVDEYAAMTGVDAKVELESWATIQDSFIAEMEKKGAKWDMVVGDSQWLGFGSTKGYYVELTSWINNNGVLDIMVPSLVGLLSEYPQNSGKYWSVPTTGGVFGMGYRKDLIDNPDQKEKAAFKAKYGYDLQVPETWAQFKDISEFYYRPNQGMYGSGIWTTRAYDAIVMALEGVIWAYGGSLGNYPTYTADGYVNSKESVAALEFYKELYQFTPPDWEEIF